jgi:hypothetical protein
MMGNGGQAGRCMILFGVWEDGQDGVVGAKY